MFLNTRDECCPCLVSGATMPNLSTTPPLKEPRLGCSKYANDLSPAAFQLLHCISPLDEFPSMLPDPWARQAAALVQALPAGPRPPSCPLGLAQVFFTQTLPNFFLGVGVPVGYSY